MGESGDDQSGLTSLPIGNGKELQMSATEIHKSYAAYLAAKYDEPTAKASVYIPGETPENYFARLQELYPDKDRQAYIQALIAIAPPAAYGPYALQGFAEGENLDPRILAVFPAELNTHIKDKGLKDQSLWYLNLKPAVAADVIRSCNLGAHAVRLFGDRRIKKTRELVEQVIFGKTNLENARLAASLRIGVEKLKIQAASLLLGEEMTTQLVRTEIERLITLDTLELYTRSTSDTLKEIAGYVGEPFRPTRLWADAYFPAIMALDNMDIYPDAGYGIIQAFDRKRTIAPITRVNL